MTSHDDSAKFPNDVSDVGGLSGGYDTPYDLDADDGESEEPHKGSSGRPERERRAAKVAPEPTPSATEAGSSASDGADLFKRFRDAAKDFPKPVLDSEQNVSDLFALFCGGQSGHPQAEPTLLHSAALGWLGWDGHSWRVDPKGKRAREAVKLLADVVRGVVSIIGDDEPKEDPQELALARRVGSANGAGAILTMASSSPEVTIEHTALDRRPWLLNVRNGTVDLKTGELRPHCRDDLITRCAPVDYDPRASAPMFERFLRDVLPDDAKREFVQTLLGLGLIGEVREHVMPVFYGRGANGKSVLLSIARRVLGDYAIAAPTTLLMATKTDQHPTDKAMLRGVRLATISETRKGGRFNEECMKALTGGDPVTARFMRENFFTFEPSHLLVMATNFRPRVDASDDAIWRRMRLVHFDVVIPKDQQDPELVEKVVAQESAGVLRWLAEGLRHYQQQGLVTPECVQVANDEYRGEEDTVGQFLDERTTRNATAEVPAQALYDAYCAWCGQNTRPLGQRTFTEDLRRRDLVQRRTRSARVWLGICLPTSWSDDDFR